MKNFIFGFIFAAIIGVLILLVCIGIVSLKTAILVPLLLAVGVFVGICIIYHQFLP